MSETIRPFPEEVTLDSNFKNIIQQIIKGVKNGMFNPEEAFRHAWRAALTKGVDDTSRITGLTQLFDSFPETIQMELTRILDPQDPKRRNALMIIAEQETKKAERNSKRISKGQRIHLRRETAGMREKLNL
jgi:hypothetical protein